MSFEFPVFEEPRRLADGRVWIAAFDSHDQRLEILYYVITCVGPDGVGQRLVAAISYIDEWRGPEFPQDVERELARIVVSGQSNTEYRGLA